MPDPTPTRAEIVLDALEARVADPHSAANAVARSLAIHHSTVDRALGRFEPIRERLREVKRDEFVAAWQAVAIKSVAAMDQFLDGEEPIPVGAKSSVSAEIRNLAVAAGIASEKALLFAGQPTAITAVTHELRSRLPDLLARATRVLEARRQALGSGGPAKGVEMGSDQGSGPEAEDR